MQTIARAPPVHLRGAKIPGAPLRATKLPQMLIFNPFGCSNINQECFICVINIEMYYRNTIWAPLESPRSPQEVPGLSQYFTGAHQEFPRCTPEVPQEHIGWGGSVCATKSSLGMFVFFCDTRDQVEHIGE